MALDATTIRRLLAIAGLVLAVIAYYSDGPILIAAVIALAIAALL